MHERTVSAQFTLTVRQGWFERGTTHHINIPTRLKRFISQGYTGSSVSVDAWAKGAWVSDGKVNRDSGQLTSVGELFVILRITEDDIDKKTLTVRGIVGGEKPALIFERIGEGNAAQSAPQRQRTNLVPFNAKSSSSYIATIERATQIRDRQHEDLVTNFAEYLDMIGLPLAYSKAIDLAITAEPPIIIEAKLIHNDWAEKIRQGVAQLYEYHYFLLAGEEGVDLILLVSEPMEQDLIDYLVIYHNIGIVWPASEGYRLVGPATSRIAARVR